MDMLNLMSMLSNFNSSDKSNTVGGEEKGAFEKYAPALSGIFNYMIDKNNYSPLTDPAFYGKNNASSSNAPLDYSLGKEARKTLGVSEGGSTPQLDNTIAKDLAAVKTKPTASNESPSKKEGLISTIYNWWNGLGNS